MASSQPLAVVCLPGLNTTSQVWGPVTAAMGLRREVLALDCPALDTVEAIADAIVEQAPARFHLVGFSFGGYVALAMLQRHPERIESLVMVGSAAVADTEAQRAYRLSCIEAAEAGRHEAVNEAGAAGTMHEDSARDPAIVERYLGLMRAYGRDRYVAHMRACLARPDRTAVLAKRRCPSLFVAGKQDRIVNPRRQREAADAAGAALTLIAGAGHQVPLEQPGALAAVLSAWLGERR